MFELCEKHNYRTDLHYHVIVGEGRWMPHDIGHPDSAHMNIIYNDKLDAFQTFKGFVRSFSDDHLDDKDYNDSLDAWKVIVEDVEREHDLELITFLGLQYYNSVFPIALIACNGCVPYGMN